MRKIFSLFLTIFIFINIFLCKEIKKEENEKEKDEKFKHLIKYHLEEIGFKNRKRLTREEFRKLFLRLFENKNKEQNESKEDLDIIFSLTNALFDYLVTEDKQKIEMDKIYDYFDPNNIVKALKTLLKQLGMEKLIDEISEPFMEILKQKGKNDNIENNDKNADL